MNKKRKRSEEMALKAYPQKEKANKKGTGIYDPNFPRRDAYRQGYEQAEKDTIERAIQWLIAHADNYIGDMEVSRYKPSKLHVGGMCWKHLKKAMEEE